MKEDKQEKIEECFVIMPIGGSDSQCYGHFREVYDYLIKPAVNDAGYSPIRADDVCGTNSIHLDIIQRLISAPIAVCDLSTCNPNVLFELGVRQSFDKPVVLIQQKGTPSIFDISSLRYIQYDPSLIYMDVVSVKKQLTDAIKQTIQQPDSNSIVKLMSVNKAKIDVMGSKDAIQTMASSINSRLENIEQLIRGSAKTGKALSYNSDLAIYKDVYCELNDMEKLAQLPEIDMAVLYNRLHRISAKIEQLQNSEDMSLYFSMRNKYYSLCDLLNAKNH